MSSQDRSNVSLMPWALHSMAVFPCTIFLDIPSPMTNLAFLMFPQTRQRCMITGFLFAIPKYVFLQSHEPVTDTTKRLARILKPAIDHIIGQWLNPRQPLDRSWSPDGSAPQFSTWVAAFSPCAPGIPIGYWSMDTREIRLYYIASLPGIAQKKQGHDSWTRLQRKHPLLAVPINWYLFYICGP